MMNYWGSYSAWGPAPFWSLGLAGLFGLVIFLVFVIVVVALEGYSLWYAAKRDEKWWFVIMLVVHTVGILNLIYLLAVAKVWPKKGADAKSSAPGNGGNTGQSAN